MNRFKGYVSRKLKDVNRKEATFLGSFSFISNWGDIKASQIREFVSSHIPDEDTWTEKPSTVITTVSPSGVRLDTLDHSMIDTEGPVAWIPRMLAAVTRVDKLASTSSKGRKRPCVAILSYNSIHLTDGQVPRKDQSVKFFITVLRFKSENQAGSFSSAAVKLWNPLKKARKRRQNLGLEDAVMEPPEESLQPSVDVIVNDEDCLAPNCSSSSDNAFDEDDISEVGYMDVGEQSIFN